MTNKECTLLTLKMGTRGAEASSTAPAAASIPAQTRRLRNMQVSAHLIPWNAWGMEAFPVNVAVCAINHTTIYLHPCCT